MSVLIPSYSQIFMKSFVTCLLRSTDLILLISTLYQDCRGRPAYVILIRLWSSWRTIQCTCSSSRRFVVVWASFLIDTPSPTTRISRTRRSSIRVNRSAIYFIWTPTICMVRNVFTIISNCEGGIRYDASIDMQAYFLVTAFNSYLALWTRRLLCRSTFLLLYWTDS